MRKMVAVVLSASLLTGCAASQEWARSVSDFGSGIINSGSRDDSTSPRSVSKSRSTTTRRSESQKVAQAVEKLGKGDSVGAARLLKSVCTGNPVPGVTDEALFRLALLSLEPNQERPVSRRGYQLLMRLKKQYPRSPWTAQAAPLLQLIDVTDGLRLQNRNVRAANQSLSKEITELNQSIEQLKNLDLELERKNR